MYTPLDRFVSFDEEQASEKINDRYDNSEDEWSPKPPILVQGSRNRRANQTAYGKTRGGDPKLTTERLFWNGVAPTRSTAGQSRF